MLSFQNKVFFCSANQISAQPKDSKWMEEETDGGEGGETGGVRGLCQNYGQKRKGGEV